MNEPYRPNTFTHAGIYPAHGAQSPTACEQVLTFLGTAFEKSARAQIPLPIIGFNGVIGFVIAPANTSATNEIHVMLCPKCGIVVESKRASEEYSKPHINAYPRSQASETGKNRVSKRPLS